MKVQISKFLQKENLVIKLIVFSTLLFNCNTSKITNNKPTKAYYTIINEIVLKDSISTIQKTMYKHYIESKKHTKEEIDSVIAYRKRRNHHLFLRQNNNQLLFHIKNDLNKKSGDLFNLFSSEKLKTVLSVFPEEGNLNSSFISSKIKIVKENKFGHQFSSPIFIGNEMIIYHLYIKGHNNASSEILVYSILKRKKPKLIKRFYRAHS